MSGRSLYSTTHPSGSVSAVLADGTTHRADFLIGSDGLNSKMRAVLNPEEESPAWSGYTCFAAIAHTVPHDIKDVGYKVRRSSWAATAQRSSHRDERRHIRGLTRCRRLSPIPPVPARCSSVGASTLSPSTSAEGASSGTLSSTCRRVACPSSAGEARARSTTCVPSLRVGATR